MFSSKNNRRYSKKDIKNKCVCFDDIICLMTMKMGLELKNRSQRLDINRPKLKMDPNKLIIECAAVQ